VRAACGQCRPCLLIEREAHPDVPLVHSGQPLPGAKKKSEAVPSLKIEQVRELERQAALAPYEARYRVPILLRFHEATLGAQNALLKTLEEPPPQVVLLLTADSADRLLPTILSRCQTLKLRPLRAAAIEQALIERWQAEPERARLLASLAGGRLGWAVRACAGEEQLAQRAERLEELLQLITAPLRQRLLYSELLAKRGRVAVSEALDLWQYFWRDVLLAAGGANTAPPMNIDRINDIQRIAGQIGPGPACQAIESIRRTLAAIERNANVRLALDVLLIELPRLSV
jgi:DNA polymerase-3 subunit delta'